jgi:Zn-dependent protease with chaperone function
LNNSADAIGGVEAPRLRATYFDGLSTQARSVTLQVKGGQLHIAGEGIDLQMPMRDIQWPERTRHGKRVAHFRNGGLVQSDDSAAWDAWSAASGQRESIIVKMQQSWRWVLGSVVFLGAMLVAVQLWGLPIAARAIVAATPMTVDAALGESTLVAIDQSFMKPTQLSASKQESVRKAFEAAVATLPPGSVPTWNLVFRKSEIGPNALALPGGTIIMTDDMVDLVDGDEEVTTAVLAHELGHVKHRHGVRMLVQATVLGAVGAVVLGDFSSLLAAVPVFLGQAQYSRAAEREADAHAVKVLRSANISPLVMVKMFDKIAALRKQSNNAMKPDAAKEPASSNEATKNEANEEDESSSGGSWLGIAFASHPADADRVAFFRAAAQ